MLISGFTFIKHGLTLGYPICESISSIAEYCDEVIINVGFDDPNLEKDDGTYELLLKTFPDQSKFKLLKSYWNPELTSQGLILSEQTNIALKECQGKYCQYIQADEIIHEEDIPFIKKGIEELEKNTMVHGLIFNYLHFYGNPNIIKYTRSIYRREVRLFRNHQGIYSYKDAQGFKMKDGSKIPSFQIKAKVYHYGWARSSMLMNKKNKAFTKLYHGKNHEEKDFTFEKIWGLKPFKGTHPKVVQKWVKENGNNVDIMKLPLRKDKNIPGLIISDFIESLTGYRMGEYKNFVVIASI